MNIVFLLFLVLVAILLFGPWELAKKESAEAALAHAGGTGTLSSWRSEVIVGLVFLGLGVCAVWFRPRLLWAHAMLLFPAGLILSAQGAWLRVAGKRR